jgi:hypothetical protein
MNEVAGVDDGRSLVLSWPPASADPLRTKVPSPGFWCKWLRLFRPRARTRQSGSLLAAVFPLPARGESARVRGTAIGRGHRPSPSSQPSPRIGRSKERPSLDGLCGEKGPHRRPPHPELASGGADPLGASRGDFRVRSGAVGDASRRTVQIALMAAQTGSSPRLARGRLFEGSADAEPPQDEVLGCGPIHKALPKHYPCP